MRGLFGNDGISTTGKANAAPALLLVLGIFFFLAPLLLGGPHHHVAAPVEAPGPTFGQAMNDRPASDKNFVGPQQPWSETATEPDWAPSDPFVRQLKSIGGMLVVVCVLVVISLKLMQRTLPRLAGKGRKSGPVMKVLARQGLTTGVQLVVVQVGTKNLVLSVSDHGAQTICELTPDEVAPPPEPVAPTTDQTLAVQEARPTATEVYGQIFKQYLGIFPRAGSKR